MPFPRITVSGHLHFLPLSATRREPPLQMELSLRDANVCDKNNQTRLYSSVLVGCFFFFYFSFFFAFSTSSPSSSSFFFYFLKILFIWEREREQRERENQTPHWVGSLTWDSIPGPWDHDLSQRQTFNQLNHLGTPGIPIFNFFKKRFYLFIRQR